MATLTRAVTTVSCCSSEVPLNCANRKADAFYGIYLSMTSANGSLPKDREGMKAQRRSARSHRSLARWTKSAWDSGMPILSI
jgi:hypothetical protein